MKSLFKVLGISVLCLVILISGVAVWQRENIKSLITSVKYTNDEIAEKIDSAKKEADNEVESYTGGQIRDFSHEEEEKIRHGEITAEEAIRKIMGEAFIQRKSFNITDILNDSTGNSIDNAESNESVMKNADDAINEHIAKLYALKAYYIGKLGELERRAAADYKALPKDKKGASGKKTVISKYIGEAAALEKECDGKVNGVLQSLNQELKAYNGDSGLIKKIRKAYEDEKVLKKSYYINNYK